MAGVATRSYLRCIHARPPPSRQPHPLGDVLIFSPLPRPPSGKALATKITLCAPGTGSSATLFESERRRRLSTNHVSAGRRYSCVAGPHHRQGSRLPASAGAEGSAVSVSVSVSCVKKTLDSAF